jgi:hypothetical protein
MADSITTDPAPGADALAALPEDLPGERTELDAWLAEAHAPGDPPPPRLAHADVGTD